MSALGTAQHRKAGNTNKGKKYPVPKADARADRGRRENARIKACLPG